MNTKTNNTKNFQKKHKTKKKQHIFAVKIEEQKSTVQLVYIGKNHNISNILFHVLYVVYTCTSFIQLNRSLEVKTRISITKTIHL